MNLRTVSFLALLWAVGPFQASGENWTTWDMGTGASLNEEKNLLGDRSPRNDTKVTVVVQASHGLGNTQWGLSWNHLTQVTWAPDARGSEYDQANFLLGWNGSGWLPPRFDASVSSGVGVDYGTSRSKPDWNKTVPDQYTQNSETFLRLSLPVQARVAFYVFDSWGAGVLVQGAINKDYTSLGAQVFLSFRTDNLRFD